MTSNKSEKERMWKVRKETQNPHGKVPSLKEISDNTEGKSNQK